MFRSLGNTARIGVAIAAAAFISLCPQTLLAQTCSSGGLFSLTLTIAALPGQASTTTYTPMCYSWGPAASSTGQGVSDELTFTHTTDTTTTALMNAAQAKQVLPSAELQQVLLSNYAIDIQMANVRILSVGETGGSNGPVEKITLKFDSVTYTFQPLNPIGQKSGPSQTFAVNFKK